MAGLNLEMQGPPPAAADDGDPGSAPRFRPDIQGLRAVAVMAVLLFHAFPSSLTGGYVGVDVFFVISGFLITGLLRREYAAEGRISFARFYSRRVNRLLPAATLVIGALALCAPLLPRVSWPELAKDIAASTGYAQNWWLAFKATDYFAAEQAAGPLQHYWSLAVEEQFYLLWPALVAGLASLATRTGRGVGRAWLVGLASVTALSLVYCIGLTARAPELAYFSSVARFWELGLGGVLALLPQVRAPRAVRELAGWGGLLLIGVSCWVLRGEDLFPGYLALGPTVGCALTIWAGSGGQIAGPGGGASALLSLRPLTYLGDISYSLYLWHWPVIVLLRGGEDRQLGLRHGLGALLLSIVLAHLSKRWVEDPFRRGRLRTPGRSALAAFAASILVAGVSVSALLTLHGQAAAADAGSRTELEGKALLGAALRARGDLPAYKSMGCFVDQKSRKVKPCEYGDRASTVRIALVGDSHAGQWEPALSELARAGGWSLTLLGKSACAFTELSVTRGNKQVLYGSCDAWRDGVYDYLETLDPTLVVVGQSRAHRPHGHDDRATHASLLAKSVAVTAAKLRARGHRVAFIADTPWPGIHGPQCLSRPDYEPGACDRSSKELSTRPDPVVMAARDDPSLRLIDLNGLVCPHGNCPAVVGDTVVFRDSHHLSASFARKLAPALLEQLAPLLD